MKRYAVLCCIFFILGVFCPVFRPQYAPEDQLLMILEHCRTADMTPSYIRCFKGEPLKKLIQDRGVKLVMNALSDLYQTHKEVAGINTTSCHDLSHIVGELAVQISHSTAETIVACTGQCGYGCVHGAIRGLISTGSKDASAIADICRPLADSKYPKAYLTACQHGVGHGLADQAGLHIPKALELCSGMDSDEAKKNCGRGVIMEIIDSPTLDHPPQPLPDDLIGWCKTFGGVYTDACFMNVGAREYYRSGDSTKAVSTCRRVPGSMQESCFDYLGQNLYFMLKQSVSNIARICRTTGSSSMNACFNGVLESAAYYERTSDVLELCDSMDSVQQKLCYRTYGEKLTYVLGDAKRNAICQTLSGLRRDACLGSRQYANEILHAASSCTTAESRTAVLSCMKKILTKSVSVNGPKPYMDALDSMDSAQWNDANRCHDIAHVVGQLGIEKEKHSVTFCSSSLCGDGCFHGAMEGLLRSGVSMERAVDVFCSQIDETEKRSRWACFHGLGHGVGSLTGSVSKGLALCDRIKSQEDMVSCGAGVLMELFQSSSTGGARIPLPEVIPDFCRTLPHAYQNVCFENSGVYELDRSKSVQKAGMWCSQVPQESQEACFMQLGGRRYNEHAGTSDIIVFCRSFGEKGNMSCISGALQESAFTDVSASAGISLCKAVSAGEKSRCFRFLGSKAEEGYGQSARIAVCSAIEPLYTQSCLGI